MTSFPQRAHARRSPCHFWLHQRLASGVIDREPIAAGRPPPLSGTPAMKALVISLAGALALTAGLCGEEAGRVDALIGQIGSERYGERDRACAELERIGATALPALRQASKHDDLETARRATELVRRIEEKQL